MGADGKTVPVPELIPPATRVHRSFLAAMTEFRAEGSGIPGEDDEYGQAIRDYADQWEEIEGFARYVRALHNEGLEESPRLDELVPQTTLWWVDRDEYLGRISIRHRLTLSLRERGGHIGYDVRPSARQRGHATAMLGAALPYARMLGIDPALLICDEGNSASRKVIEVNGGILQDKRDNKLRYWIPTL